MQSLAHEVNLLLTLCTVIERIGNRCDHCGRQTPPEAPSCDEGRASLVDLEGAFLLVEMLRVKLQELADCEPVFFYLVTEFKN